MIIDTVCLAECILLWSTNAVDAQSKLLQLRFDTTFQCSSFSSSSLPSGIFLLYVNCKRAYDELKKRVAGDDVAAEEQSGVLGADVRRLEEAIEHVCERKLPELVAPVCEASLSGADFHWRNQKMSHHFWSGRVRG